MHDLFSAPNERAHLSSDLATAAIVERLAAGVPIARRDLNDAMTAAYGGTDAEGRWTQRDSFEMLERAPARHLAAQSTDALDSLAAVRPLIDLAERLPTQTVRSEEQIDAQQFSTPIDLAGIAAPGSRCGFKFFDKTPGNAPPATIQRRTVAELLDVLTIPERGELVDEPARSPAMSPGKKTTGLSLFRSVKSAPPPAPRAFLAPKRNVVLPVAYTPLETPAPLLEQTGVYLPYWPSRIVFEATGEHPTALVESSPWARSRVRFLGMSPHLPERTVSERLLSASQLEKEWRAYSCAFAMAYLDLAGGSRQVFVNSVWA